VINAGLCGECKYKLCTPAQLVNFAICKIIIVPIIEALQSIKNRKRTNVKKNFHEKGWAKFTSLSSIQSSVGKDNSV
jgi:hypothetical protein